MALRNNLLMDLSDLSGCTLAAFTVDNIYFKLYNELLHKHSVRSERLDPL